jgi:hypothetical protein
MVVGGRREGKGGGMPVNATSCMSLRSCVKLCSVRDHGFQRGDSPHDGAVGSCGVGSSSAASLTLLEVFKRVYQQRDEGDALQAIAVMGQGRVVDLDAPLALSAARLGGGTEAAARRQCGPCHGTDVQRHALDAGQGL